jgi:hypothetical protein
MLHATDSQDRCRRPSEECPKWRLPLLASIEREIEDALVKALFASAFNFAAPALLSSEKLPTRLTGRVSGDGSDEGGVDPEGDPGSDDEDVLMDAVSDVLDGMFSSWFTYSRAQGLA